MVDSKTLIEKYGIYPGYIDWFNNLKFPQPRKKLNHRTHPIIEIGADGMRVGKTTAVKVLVEGLKKNGQIVLGSFEDFSKNPHLKKSYSDPKKAILHSQKWFISRKFQQLKSAPKDKIFIQDVHPEMDFCYAVSNALMGRMSLHQFEKYLSHYNTLNWKSVSRPDLLVYLKVSDNKLLDRVKNSLRKFETVDEKYFLIMKLVNRTWFNQAKSSMDILEVSTDDFDFANNKTAQKEFVSKVKEKLFKTNTSKKQSKNIKTIRDKIKNVK